jgi:hypothetical protein
MTGTSIVVADRWFPSSKTCSDCGHVIVFECDSVDQAKLYVDEKPVFPNDPRSRSARRLFVLQGQSTRNAGSRTATSESNSGSRFRG